MPNLEALRDQPCLTAENVRLVQLDQRHLDGLWQSLRDPEVIRLTGTHATFTREYVAERLAAWPGAAHRADWAVTAVEDGRFLGDAALNELDEANESMSFRIALSGPAEFGKGYGTEATRLVLDFAFDTVGLHRVALEVFAHNPRARRVYEKCGFVAEGVLREALYWEGERHDVLVMSVLASDHRLRWSGGQER